MSTHEERTPTTRLVDVLVDHGAPVTFEALCRRVVTPRTRYLVLDLDRTVHLGLNMGELLGWELCAHQAYGEAGLDAAEAARTGRFLLDLQKPVALLRYLSKGLRVWAYPGLYYLLWGKLAFHNDWLRRRSFRRFGAEPMRRVQRVPQIALMRHLEEASPETLRALARRVWRRYRDQQVVTREALELVRQLAPGVKIVLTSASPQPMVEVAAEALGVDVVGYSTLDRINSGEAKLEHLRALCPDLDAVEVVGISDTGYREDHCWAEAFSVVVDVNSSTPFGVVVGTKSPLREVHSAQVLTREERRRRDAGDADYLDPRRPEGRLEAQVTLRDGELRAAVGTILSELEALSSHSESAPGRTAYAKVRLHERARRVAGDLLGAVIPAPAASAAPNR